MYGRETDKDLVADRHYRSYTLYPSGHLFSLFSPLYAPCLFCLVFTLYQQHGERGVAKLSLFVLFPCSADYEQD